jgi:hypothetical protein
MRPCWSTEIKGEILETGTYGVESGMNSECGAEGC